MALFQDWLSDGSILIATRFGSTQQIHRVTAPGGDRAQITFQMSPSPAPAHDSRHAALHLQRDTGGDEWFQVTTAGLWASRCN